MFQEHTSTHRSAASSCRWYSSSIEATHTQEDTEYSRSYRGTSAVNIHKQSSWWTAQHLLTTRRSIIVSVWSDGHHLLYSFIYLMEIVWMSLVHLRVTFGHSLNTRDLCDVHTRHDLGLHTPVTLKEGAVDSLRHRNTAHSFHNQCFLSFTQPDHLT